MKTAAGCLLSILLLFGKGDSRADEKSRALLDRCERAYKNLQFEKVVNAIDGAGAAIEGMPVDEYLRLLKIGAFSLAALGRARQAEEYFRKIFCLEPDYRPERKLSPKMMAPFKKALQNKPEPLRVDIQAPEQLPEESQLILSLEIKDQCRLVEHIDFYLRRGSSGEFIVSSIPALEAADGQVQIPSQNWRQVVAGGNLFWFARVIGERQITLMEIASKTNPSEIVVRKEEKVVPIQTSEAIAVEESAASLAEPVSPWYKRWWVWTIVGAVIVSAAGGTAAALMHGGASSGPSDFNITIGHK